MYRGTTEDSVKNYQTDDVIVVEEIEIDEVDVT